MNFKVGGRAKIYDGTEHEILEIRIVDRGDEDPDVWLGIKPNHDDFGVNRKRWVNGEYAEVVS